MDCGGFGGFFRRDRFGVCAAGPGAVLSHMGGESGDGWLRAFAHPCDSLSFNNQAFSSTHCAGLHYTSGHDKSEFFEELEIKGK